MNDQCEVELSSTSQLHAPEYPEIESSRVVGEIRIPDSEADVYWLIAVAIQLDLCAPDSMDSLPVQSAIFWRTKVPDKAGYRRQSDEHLPMIHGWYPCCQISTRGV